MPSQDKRKPGQREKERDSGPHFSLPPPLTLTAPMPLMGALENELSGGNPRELKG